MGGGAPIGWAQAIAWPASECTRKFMLGLRARAHNGAAGPAGGADQRRAIGRMI
jgi:hypothetical protein